MIPKKIHYCWFGGNPLPESAKKYIETWKKYCPDYEIIEWNESNFDVNMTQYTQWCYENKKYAFLSDYARLVIVEKNGGIYFDTDVEVVRSFDDLLEYKAFFGFENNDNIASGLGFGSEIHNFAVQSMIQAYDELPKDKYGVWGCPKINTMGLSKTGLELNGKMQVINGVAFLPKEYLNPYDSLVDRLYKTKNTHSIHWFKMSWNSDNKKLKKFVVKYYHRFNRLIGKE